jgi:hypothetical protein
MKLTKFDIAGLMFLAVFLLLVLWPSYVPKNGCEVARPNYKCASFEDVMVENCAFWGEYKCDTSADASLTDVEWYIKNMCEMQNSYHGSGLDCSNLKSACNKISASQVCPTGFVG